VFYISPWVIRTEFTGLRSGWLLDNALARVAALLNGGGAYFPPLIKNRRGVAASAGQSRASSGNFINMFNPYNSIKWPDRY